MQLIWVENVWLIWCINFFSIFTISAISYGSYNNFEDSSFHIEIVNSVGRCLCAHCSVLNTHYTYNDTVSSQSANFKMKESKDQKELSCILFFIFFLYIFFKSLLSMLSFEVRTKDEQMPVAFIYVFKHGWWLLSSFWFFFHDSICL